MLFGVGKRILEVLVEIRGEMRRIRIAQEEILDIWKAADALTDPLGEVPPRSILPDSGEFPTPPQRPRRKLR